MSTKTLTFSAWLDEELKTPSGQTDLWEEPPGERANGLEANIRSEKWEYHLVRIFLRLEKERRRTHRTLSPLWESCEPWGKTKNIGTFWKAVVNKLDQYHTLVLTLKLVKNFNQILTQLPVDLFMKWTEDRWSFKENMKWGHTSHNEIFNCNTEVTEGKIWLPGSVGSTQELNGLCYRTTVLDGVAHTHLKCLLMEKKITILGIFLFYSKACL